MHQCLYNLGFAVKCVVIKFLNPTLLHTSDNFLPIQKMNYRRTHGECHCSTPSIVARKSHKQLD